MGVFVGVGVRVGVAVGVGVALAVCVGPGVAVGGGFAVGVWVFMMGMVAVTVGSVVAVADIATATPSGFGSATPTPSTPKATYMIAPTIARSITIICQIGQRRSSTIPLLGTKTDRIVTYSWITPKSALTGQCSSQTNAAGPIKLPGQDYA